METPPMPRMDLFKLVMQYHMLGHPVATIAQETKQPETVIVEMLDEMVCTMRDALQQHEAHPPKGIACSLPRDVQAVMYWHTLGYSIAAIANRANLTADAVAKRLEEFADWLDYMPDEELAPAGPVQFAPNPRGDVQALATVAEGHLATFAIKDGRLAVEINLPDFGGLDLETCLRSLVQLLASYKPV